jgi:hypothetical protein
MESQLVSTPGALCLHQADNVVGARDPGAAYAQIIGPQSGGVRAHPFDGSLF